MSGPAQVIELPAEGARGIDVFTAALIREPESFADLRDAFRRVEANLGDKGACYLTLDDLGQCRYTSGHAQEKFGLDVGVEYPADDHDSAVADYQRACFSAAMSVLRDPARARAWSQVCGKFTVWLEDLEALVKLNKAPDALLDEVHVVQCLPSKDAQALLANLPNGYFATDWDPFDNSAVVDRICSGHGFRLLGIGAATMAFERSDPLDPASAAALQNDLMELYGHPDAPAWAALTAAVVESGLLVLGYTEDFAELVG